MMLDIEALIQHVHERGFFLTDHGFINGQVRRLVISRDEDSCYCDIDRRIWDTWTQAELIAHVDTTINHFFVPLPPAKGRS